MNTFLPPSPTFLTLPVELRLEIYSYLWTPLTIPNSPPPKRSPHHPPTRIWNIEIVPSHQTQFLSSSSLPSANDLSLLQTCRKLYFEARDLAYARHTFTFKRDLAVHPLTYEPTTAPFSLIKTISMPFFKIQCPARGIPIEHLATRPYGISPKISYTFKEIRLVVRRFRLLQTVVILTDSPNQIQQGLLSRRAHVQLRRARAKRKKDERAGPSYDLELVGGRGVVDLGMRWKLTVGLGVQDRERGREVRGVEIVVCGCEAFGLDPPSKEILRGFPIPIW